MEFAEQGDDAKVKDSNLVRAISNLLSVQPSETEKALCKRVVAARGDVVEKGHTIEQAKFGRDAFAKVNFIKRRNHSLDSNQIITIVLICRPSMTECSRRLSNL